MFCEIIDKDLLVIHIFFSFQNAFAKYDKKVLRLSEGSRLLYFL